MTDPRIEELELDLLLEGIFRAYHYDFRSYARSSLRRRIAQILASHQLPTATALLDRLIHDPDSFASVLPGLTIQVSDLFRDPGYWRTLRGTVVPVLSTYPFLRVWIAGCGAGEEAYSMAILLHEEGLLERTQIYATDIDAQSLRDAEAGVYSTERLRAFSENYFAAGGRASLSDYYEATSSHAVMSPALRRRILFSDHSLATDAAFAEVQLISCRNVLIYFEKTLQNRVVGLFLDSLCQRGFVGLGMHESLQFMDRAADFEVFSKSDNVYRAVAR